jgi:disulfide bond formation protein DsbB
MTSGRDIWSATRRAIGDRPQAAAALAIAGGGAATILGAWFFQYGLGLEPCPLCLDQRIPYYIAIPLAGLLAVAAIARAPRGLIVAGLGVVALVLLVGAGLGVYHAGIEWGLWPGPRDCAAVVRPPARAGDLLQQLQTLRIVRCDEAPWRFAGLSLAGWNVVISAALAACALAAMAQRPRPA